jgi:serine/threonine protein kinase
MTERLPDGTVFGVYTIEGLIAAGGMGQVYAARHNIFGSTVALKVLHPALHADEGWRVRFNEEGLVGTQLKHPHVLSARELVHNEGRIALVFDLVPGGQTLEKVSSREFRDGLMLGPALQVFLKILQGMDYLHCKSIVHGDLKPENVLIEGDFRRPETWVPKVTDFGTVALIANPVEIDGRPAVVATPRYASPEHLYGVDRIEVRSDIYCLALIMHFLLSGRHASNAQNVREAAERVLLPVPIVNLVDQPEPLVELFKRATAIEPVERYETVRQLALGVRGVLTAVGADLELPDVAADLATEVDEERERQRKKSHRGNMSQAATEPDPRPRTSYEQLSNRTPARGATPRDIVPAAPTPVMPPRERAPDPPKPEYARRAASYTSAGPSAANRESTGEIPGFIQVPPEGASIADRVPEPSQTRSAAAAFRPSGARSSGGNRTAAVPKAEPVVSRDGPQPTVSQSTGAPSKPVQPISAAARQMTEPAPASPGAGPWLALGGVGLVLLVVLGLVALSLQ